MKKALRFLRFVMDCLCSGKFSQLCYELSGHLPDWIFKYNSGLVFESKAPRVPVRKRDRFVFESARAEDSREISALVGVDEQVLKHRDEIGDRGFVLKDTQNRNRIVSAQWVHLGPVHLRGYGYTIDCGQDEAYLYGAVSAEDVRFLGVFNSSFMKVVELLGEEGVRRFYALVEFWNKVSYNYHIRANFEPIMKVTLVSLLAIKIVLLNDVRNRRRDIRVFRNTPTDIAVI